MELIVLAGAVFAAWYFLWPRQQTASETASTTTPVQIVHAPVVTAAARSAGPSADDAIGALTVVRDRLVLLGAPPEKIEAVLALAPALLVKEGTK